MHRSLFHVIPDAAIYLTRPCLIPDVVVADARCEGRGGHLPVGAGRGRRATSARPDQRVRKGGHAAQRPVGNGAEAAAGEAD